MVKSGRQVGKVEGGRIHKAGFNPSRAGAKTANPSFARAIPHLPTTASWKYEWVPRRARI